ncbi:MAG TPA: tetratricopeptide repeat protein [Vineibacter sp.]|nr:tetratricopeptide repeat protein [Vineibacter sp.]
MRHGIRRLTSAVVVAAAFSALAAAPGIAAGGSSDRPDTSTRSSTPPKPANPDFENAKAAIHHKQYSNAIGWLQRVVAAEPNNPEAYNLLGFATRKSGNPAGSLAHYQKALSLDPKHLGAHEYIGEAYLMLDQPQRAEEHLARLDQLCTFGCKEHRELKAAIANYKKGIKPSASK